MREPPVSNDRMPGVLLCVGTIGMDLLNIVACETRRVCGSFESSDSGHLRDP